MTPAIGYDARMALGRYRGMGAWLRSLLAGHEREWLGFCAAGEGDPALRLSAGGFRFFPAWEQVSLPARVARAGVTTFFAPFNTAPLCLPARVRLVLAVHDLIFMEGRDALPFSPSLYQNCGRVYRRWVTPRAIARAEHIVTVSEAVRAELLARFPIDPARLTVIPNTIRASWFTPSEAAPHEASAPAILTISGEAPSKNLLRALRSFALLERAGLLPQGSRLAIAGVSEHLHAHFIAEARRYGLRLSPVWLPFVSEADLEREVRAATVVFVPSLFEGFGRPLLEAMACGTPAVASAIPALREIGGAGTVFCDPYSPKSMAEALGRVLTDGGLRRALTIAGRTEAARFHPDRVQARIDAFCSGILGT